MRSIMEERIATRADGAPVDAAAVLAVLHGTPTIELEATFRELDTLHNASGAYLLMVVAELDTREVGREDGARDTSDWLVWTARVSQARARALVETARALPARPKICATAMEGRFSGEQLEAVVQFATPETDARWAEDGPGWTATALRAEARRQRTVTTDEAVERDDHRRLKFCRERDSATARVRRVRATSHRRRPRRADPARAADPHGPTPHLPAPQAP